MRSTLRVPGWWLKPSMSSKKFCHSPGSPTLRPFSSNVISRTCRHCLSGISGWLHGLVSGPTSRKIRSAGPPKRVAGVGVPWNTRRSPPALVSTSSGVSPLVAATARSPERRLPTSASSAISFGSGQAIMVEAIGLRVRVSPASV